MKRLLKSLIFSFLVLVFGSAISSPEPMSRGRIKSLTPDIKYDTAGLRRMLKVDTFHLSIIPPSSGVQFYKNRIVFLSLSKNEMKMSSKQISFGAVEAYSAEVEDSVPGKHNIFSPLSSFSYPCEGMTFSHDYNTVYFTMIPKKANKEKIYSAKLALNSQNQTILIIDFTPLEFCSDNESYSHPALSSDDNIMIFASDRRGSIGGMDLYVTKKTGLIWSDPVNLGNIINTAGNEFFPFLDSENNLYFSSDRLPGYGGYDIYTCKFNGNGWDKPLTLSDLINSDRDDIAFTINKTDGTTAFFTRRQKSGNQDIQLFKINIKKEVLESSSLTLSYIFNGKPVSKSYLAVSAQSGKIKPVLSEPLKTRLDTQAFSETVQAKPAKKVVSEPAKKNVSKQVVAESAKTKPEKRDITMTEPGVKNVENKAAITLPEKSTKTEQNYELIYKVQLLPNKNQIKAKKMEINGTSYKIDEYLYHGVVRYTIGEFHSLREATALQTICRQAEYSQSFVVVFRNNIRTLDQKLFK
jgi:hypothetical protein